MRVLITGASGFIGGHVCRAVQERGWDIRTLHRGARLPGIPDHLPADVTRELPGDALSNVDAVIHLPARVTWPPPQ